MNSLIDQMLATASEFIDTAYKMIDSCRRKDKARNSPCRLVIAFYMRRAIELTESFVILCEEDRAADYAVLLRSFWEMGINLDYIFRDDKKKEINAIRYLLHEYPEKIKLLTKNRKELEASGYDVGGRIEKEKKEFEREKASLSKKYKSDGWTWPKISERAKDSPSWVIQQAYNLYAYLCGVEHHDASFGKCYVEDVECKPLKNIQRPSLLRPEVNLIQCRSILLVIMKTFNNEFYLRWGKKLKQLEAKQDQEYQEMKKADDEAKVHLP